MSVSPIRTDDHEPFIRLAEGFLDHPDVLAIGPLAMYMHICAIAWCHRNGTNGRIPVEQTSRLVAWDLAEDVIHGASYDNGPMISPGVLVKRLTDAEIWQESDSGYYVILDCFEP